MALNASGPIALAGSTAGVSIALELSLGTTTAITLNDAAVRTLAGVPSGAIIMPTNFYGKSSGPTIGLYYAGLSSGYNSNIVARVNVCGTLIGSEANVGTARALLTGAAIGSVGVFYRGYTTVGTNIVTRINSSGALIGSQTNAGRSSGDSGGANIGTNAVYYGGCCGCMNNRVTKINACGTLAAAESFTSGSPCYYRGQGAPVSTYGIYKSNATLVKLNSCGTRVSAVVRTALNFRCCFSGSSAVGSVAMFYGGLNQQCCCCDYDVNSIARINTCLAIVGCQTAYGTSRADLAGAKVGTNASFFGGCNTNGCYYNLVTRINACGAQVGSETHVGSARRGPGGASF